MGRCVGRLQAKAGYEDVYQWYFIIFFFFKTEQNVNARRIIDNTLWATTIFTDPVVHIGA